MNRRVLAFVSVTILTALAVLVLGSHVLSLPPAHAQAILAFSLPSLQRVAAAQDANSGTPVNSPGRRLPTLFTQAWAVVNADGTLARGTGDVVSSTKIDGFAGAYDVEFDDDVRGCLYVATIGNSTDSGTEPSGEITTNGRVSSVNGVFIQTGDSSGAVADRGFHLLVTCYGF